jgi:hypothetical protein
LRDIWRTAVRIRQIEEDVNNRVGETLLVWEGWKGASRRCLKAFIKKPSPQSN